VLQLLVLPVLHWGTRSVELLVQLLVLRWAQLRMLPVLV
jgi:hypothetical protein